MRVLYRLFLLTLLLQLSTGSVAKETVMGMSKKVYDAITQAQELIDAESYPEALENLQKVRERRLNNYEAAHVLNMIGYILYQTDKMGEALTVYEEALAWELQQRGLTVERQKPIPLVYKSQTLSTPLRLDLLLNDLVIVECKATTQYNPIFEAQLLTYLRLTGLKLGLVINFGERLVKDGIHRVVNGL